MRILDILKDREAVVRLQLESETVHEVATAFVETFIQHGEDFDENFEEVFNYLRGADSRERLQSKIIQLQAEVLRLRDAEPNEEFDAFFDNCCPEIKLGYLTLSPSRALRLCDPVSYREEVNCWLAWMNIED